MPLDLTPVKALIFRIVHRENVSWLLDNGVHCPSSPVRCPTYVNIGNSDLIDKRSRRLLPNPPGGMLSDYAPFYFTPCSPMFLNIRTGRGGVRARENEEIVILVSSLNAVRKAGINFAFSDRHASLSAARFSSDLQDLKWIDWASLQAKDFRKDPERPDKFETYQAEALVLGALPVSVLLGIGCFDDATTAAIALLVADRELPIKVLKKPGWYFQ